ncbi:hypothetical protein NPIL_30401 [Nephila pilipes]|uniref:HAT C-terminal dimerisation domain-containing protein n=1 Tax=Nephila pilipes TaxID=299642 RepID=A0A8X6N402_NEPPI|nr:hypothetical protein NPIL_30401 [Nephila pilipes]
MLSNGIKEGESSDSYVGQLFPAPSSSREDVFWGNYHKMVQDNWSVRNMSQLFEEFDTGSRPLQPEFSVYFKNPILKLEDDLLKFFGFNYNHKKSHIAEVATKYLSVMATSVSSEILFSITGEIVEKEINL